MKDHFCASSYNTHLRPTWSLIPQQVTGLVYKASGQDSKRASKSMHTCIPWHGLRQVTRQMQLKGKGTSIYVLMGGASNF